MDPLSPMSPQARNLLDRYREARPGAGTRARNWAALARRIEVAQWRWWWVGAAAFALAAAALVLAFAIGRGLQAVADRSAPADAAVDVPVQPPAERAHVVVPVVATPSPVLPAAAAAPLPLSTPAPRRVVAAPPVDPLLRETTLLAELRTAIERDDRSAAARLVAEHARGFPDGAFVEERAAYAVVLACRGRDDDAASQRTAFSRRFAGSHHTKMIGVACDGTEPPTGNRD